MRRVHAGCRRDAWTPCRPRPCWLSSWDAPAQGEETYGQARSCQPCPRWGGAAPRAGRTPPARSLHECQALSERNWQLTVPGDSSPQLLSCVQPGDVDDISVAETKPPERGQHQQLAAAPRAGWGAGGGASGLCSKPRSKNNGAFHSPGKRAPVHPGRPGLRLPHGMCPRLRYVYTESTWGPPSSRHRGDERAKGGTHCGGGGYPGCRLWAAAGRGARAKAGSHGRLSPQTLGPGNFVRATASQSQSLRAVSAPASTRER